MVSMEHSESVPGQSSSQPAFAVGVHLRANSTENILRQPPSRTLGHNTAVCKLSGKPHPVGRVTGSLLPARNNTNVAEESIVSGCGESLRPQAPADCCEHKPPLRWKNVEP